MKYKIATISFQKKFDIQVLVPADATADAVYTIAEREVADGLRDFDDPEWDAELMALKEVDVDPASMRWVTVPTKPYPHKRPAAAIFSYGDLLVLDPEKERFVCPEDSDWWVVTDEQLEAMRARDRLLQDIQHPDQMPLFGGK